jgi:hypothetical protein
MTFFTKLKNIFWFVSLLFCYTLFSVGQIWLFISKQNEKEFYNILTKQSSDWVNAHLVLMLSLLLTIPAYFGIKEFLKTSKQNYWIDLSIFFICLWAFVLFGQFTIDLCLVEIFHLQQETAYEILDKIKANSIINALFYDNSKIFTLFKFLDLWMIAQICLGIALVASTKIPKWALILFFIALLLTTFGILIHPFYGRVIKRLSYTLFSVSFLPIAINILRKNKLPGDPALAIEVKRR